MSGEGEKRRSDRIAAIEAKKSDKSEKGDTSSSVNGQTDRRKCIKRKSLAEFAQTSICPSAQQVAEGENNQNHPNGNGNMSSGHPLPEKRFLVSALDILQRRDKRDLFAQPVDSDVEYYYEVIEEPMDFSTLRTKLHSDVYKTFEEFEHDVLLIFKNAMFFNGEKTLYYKQARAIVELSKRVLETLKRDPGKLEQLEHDLSQEQRRPVQRCRAKRGKPRVYRSLSLNILSDQGGCETNYNSQSHHGAKEFIPPRQSYKPSEFIVSDIFDDPRTLVPGNGFGIGYRNSLMKFVKNLGPVAQRVAAEKLSLLSAPVPQPSYLQETTLLSSSLSVSRASSYDKGMPMRTRKPPMGPSTYLRPSRFSEASLSQMNLSQPMGPYMRLLTMDEGTSDQKAQFADAAINMQPLPMIQWPQNKAAVGAPSESIPMGMGPARSPYPQRFGLNLLDMDEQAHAARASQQVYGQWRSTLPQDLQNSRRHLMPPPGDRSKRPPPPPGC